ncbi:Coiled-coil domain-containing protein [Schistosoma japonicum]|nr:Coiled-coil domain-containing protein [Schistosoma japonicum]
MDTISQQRLDELKAKLTLLESDRKAYLENTVQAISKNKKRVSDLRFENNKLRNILRERLSADQHIINHVLHNRQADRVCMANKTGAVAIELLDYRTCDAKKKLNSMKHMIVQKEKKIEEIKSQYREITETIEFGNATYAGTNKEGKMLRSLENRLDKARLKYHEAEHIKKTYEQIKEKLQDEHLTYEHNLDLLEKQVKATQSEVSELQQMYNNAIMAKDMAQQELRFQEEHVANERRRREMELTNMRKIAEGKKLASDKSDHQQGRESLPSVDAQSESIQGDSVGVVERIQGTGGIGITEEQQMKIAKYEESFQIIKEVTGLSDLDQIVKRFESQGETLRNLNNLRDKAEEQCQELRKQRDALRQEFEELKYSGETELESVNQVMRQHEEEAQAEAERRVKCQQNVEDANRLLIECKTGVDHIYDKLSFLSVKAAKSTEHYIEDGKEVEQNIDNSDIPEMLKICNNKLDELMDSLNDVNIEEQLNLIEQEEFHTTNTKK